MSGKRAIKNASWLTLGHVFGYIIPLLELPILTRSLGVSGYGQIVLAQSFGLIFATFLEFGFNINAAKRVSIARDDSKKIKSIYSGVMTAKLMLSSCVAVFVFIFYFLFSSDGHLSRLMWIGVFLYSASFGFSPLWYFQGVERVIFPMVVDIFCRLLGLLVLWMLVSKGGDVAMAFYVMILFAALNVIITNIAAIKAVGICAVNFKEGIREVRFGFHSFLYRSSSNILQIASPALVGSVAGSYAAGLYAPAEKVVRAAVGVGIPILAVVLPWMSKKFHDDRARALKVSWFLIGGFAFIGVLAALMIVFAGPQVLAIITGDGYKQSQELVLLFAWLVPMRLVAQAIAMSLLVPVSQEKFAGTSMIISCLITLLIGVVLIAHSGAVGMVWATLIGEFILLSLFFYKARRI
ncbi:oligosaccharide flippase family protein [Alloalcanivorax xenomutans]|uniref:oligosaccharide flippase family protein n=1 Tax=Alloalcanivorax xenomutans TaxID=1094342 RepID=UPI0029342292|nr:oligosaccharide flippase family protein [Alloalcanivorax xenomutans]WOD30075.1 oligosaccharide flippase family protein [Alloalcanivorax xenomutans]